MANEFKEKLATIHFSRPSHRKPKVTRDELGNDMKEHWDDRVDVVINAPAVRVKSTTTEER